MLISYIAFKSNNFPFPFLQGFADFINKDAKKKFILLIDNSGNSIPAVLWKSAFLKIMQLQFVPIDRNGKRLSVEAEQLFLDELVSFVSEEKLCDKIVQGTNYSLFNTFPKKAIYAPFGSFVLDLNISLDELFANLHSKNRNVIRNAQKHGVKILYGRSVLNDFYLLYRSTTNRSGLYCEGLDYFSKLFDCFNNNIICGVAYFNNEPMGGLFVLFSKYGGYYLFGASADKPAINGSVNYLQWDLIRLLKDKGVNCYDFVGARLSNIQGTPLAGIQQFKARFGSHLDKGYIWKLEIHGLKCWMYKVLLKLKLALKGDSYPLDIIDQERIAYRHQNMDVI